VDQYIIFDKQIPNGKQGKECDGSESRGDAGNPKNVGNCAWSRISRKLDLNREIRGRDKFSYCEENFVCFHFTFKLLCERLLQCVQLFSFQLFCFRQ